LRYLGADADLRFTVKIVLAFGVIALCYYLAHRQSPPPPTESDPPNRTP